MIRFIAALLAMVAFLATTPAALANPQGRTTTATTAQQPAGTPAAPVACNNSPELCSRAYSNITHMGAHDSAFLRDASTGNSIAGNQYYNATAALSAGIRLLQAQVHLSSSTLRLCHTLCELLDAGPLDSWLAKIKAWLDGNRNEVVTLLLVNADNQPASSFAAAFSSSGIASYAFTPPSPSSSSGSGSANNNTTTTWPTLQALITANTRLVTFIAGITPDASHPYLLNEFDHAFETPYNTTSLAAFGCALDRPSTANSSAAALASGLLPLVNHFAYTSLAQGVEIPDAGDIDTTNSPSETAVGALGRHVSGCVAEWGGVKPVFVLVDFWDRGPAVEAADRVNGVVGSGRRAPVTSAAPGRVCVRGWLRWWVRLWMGRRDFWEFVWLVLFRGGWREIWELARLVL